MMLSTVRRILNQTADGDRDTSRARRGLYNSFTSAHTASDFRLICPYETKSTAGFAEGDGRKS